MPERIIDLPKTWCEFYPNTFDSIMALSGLSYRRAPGRETIQVNVLGNSYFIKKHFGLGWREIIKTLLSFKLPILDASTEWKALMHLKKNDILAPNVIGYGQDNYSFSKRQSFIILEDLKYTMSLEALVMNQADYFDSVRNRRHWIRLIATLVKRLHLAGVQHRDLYLCHFLFSQKNLLPNIQEIYVIDLHRAKIKKSLSVMSRIKDLAALYFSSWPINLSGRDKLCFIQCYTKDCYTRSAIFWKIVAKRAQSLYQRYQKKQPVYDVFKKF